MCRKGLNPNCKGNKRDKVALMTTSFKNVKFKVIKIGAGCQYVGWFYYSQNLKWAAQTLRLGRMGPAGWTLLCSLHTEQKLIVLKAFFSLNTSNT